MGRNRSKAVRARTRAARRGAVIVLLGVLLGACGRRHAAELAVRRIGADNLAQSLETMRPEGGPPAGQVPVPPEAWPDSLRSLEPQAVRVGREGVFIKLQSGFVGESGLLVAFEGTTVPAGKGTDPAFEHLEGRVYWYRIKG